MSWRPLLELHLMCVDANGGGCVVKNDEFYRGALKKFGGEVLGVVRGRGYCGQIDRGMTGVPCLAVRR